MRKLSYLFILCLVSLTSCVSRNTADQLQNQRDSLAMVVNNKDSLIGEVFSAINAISENLSAIKTRENILTVTGSDDVAKRPAEQINDDINAIDQLLQENRAKIAAMERSAAQLRKANVKIKGLEKMISNLNSQLSTKDGEIAQLKSNLSQLGVEVNTLHEKVAEQTTQVEHLSADKSSLESEVQHKTTQLHTVYYIIGSQKELLNAQIVHKSGFIGRTLAVDKNRSLDSFTQADTRFLTELPIGHKNITIVTSHPEGSYQLVEGEGKVIKSLVIKDADQFWSTSKILVVSYK
ncbi:MAG: hypothetical protein RSB23_04955 [Alistipes sp.]